MTTSSTATQETETRSLDELKKVLGDPGTDGWLDRSRLADRDLRGRKAKLRTGAPIINSTDPRLDTGHILRRETVVTIRSALPARPGEYRDDPPHPAEITWAGAGGYWRTAKLDDVIELIAED